MRKRASLTERVGGFAWALSLLIVWGCAHREPLFVPGTELLPRIERITPDGATEEGELTVRLLVTHLPFISPMRVYFGTSRARIVRGTRLDAVTREIVVVAPPHPPGSVPVRVVSGAGTPSEREALLPDGFQYVARLQVEKVEPETVSAAGETRVTIVGRGFAGSVRVLVDDVPVLALERLSDESLVATVPPREAGKASLTVVAHGGLPYEQRAVLPDALTYVSPTVGFFCLVATRLVDLTTSEVLDSRLVAVNEQMEGGALPRDKLWEYVAGRIAGELPLQLVQPAQESVGLIVLPSYPRGGAEPERERAATALSVALEQTLRGRGIRVVAGAEASGLTTLFPLDEVAFGTLLQRREPANVDVNKALVARLVALGESHTPTPADPFETLVAEYRRLESLASSLPEAATAKTTLLVRLPERDGTFPQSELEILREDAVLAGVRQRMSVLDKLNPVTAKPPWLYANSSTPTDPLGYSSWTEFRREHAGVESVFFYKPDAVGLYARLVDAFSGRIVWSGRLLTVEDVFSEAFDASVHDRIRDLADQSNGAQRVPASALVWVAPRGNDSDADVWGGIVSSLVDAGVSVLEPMTTVYRRREATGGRLLLAETAETSDVWFDAIRAGVTYILEYALDRSHPEKWALTFRLVDASSGAVHATWSADEKTSNGDAGP